MIFTKDLLFLHVPKMAGMSVTRYLLNNLKGEIHLVVPHAAFEHARKTVQFDDVHPRLHYHDGLRHEDLSQAALVVSKIGYSLDQFQKILAVIRNPYALERSYFLHLQKPHVQKFRSTQGQGKESSIAMQLASSGNFDAFCQQAPFYGASQDGMERFYTLDGVLPPAQLCLLRFENLAEDLANESQHFSYGRASLGHQNASNYGVERSGSESFPLSPAAEEAIYRKYHYLFKYYDRRPVQP